MGVSDIAFVVKIETIDELVDTKCSHIGSSLQLEFLLGIGLVALEHDDWILQTFGPELMNQSTQLSHSILMIALRDDNNLGMILEACTRFVVECTIRQEKELER